MPATRPNILWFSMEDTTPRFGCYGDKLARTPNLDRLAAGGCIYPNAFCVSGVSAPSRAAIVTGMYPTTLGAQHMRTTHIDKRTPELPTPYDAVVPPYVKCFPEYLRMAGYYCTNNEKTDYQFAPPFTAWDECGKTGHWRNRREPGQPFFAVFNPTVTHESGMWPKPDKPLRTDPDAVELPPYLPNTRKAREALARQYDNIAESDARLGEILGQLEADRLAENTLVFVWSDHGEGLPRRKRWPYDSGTRIPLIVRWPGTLQPGSRNERLVSLVDLGPTVLSLCGVPLPAHCQGQPFLGPLEKPREYVYSTRDRHDNAYDMVRSVRDTRYRYVRHFYPGTPYLPWVPYRNRHPVAQELYRLHAEGKLEGDQNFLFRTRPRRNSSTSRPTRTN
ncbi:MAG: sulfatase [Planctomycetota bacterium]|nr:sulfatase [Planctomycetota bacterium]